MTKTQVLQEIRRMRFKEAYGGWRERGSWGEGFARKEGHRARASQARSNRSRFTSVKAT